MCTVHRTQNPFFTKFHFIYQRNTFEYLTIPLVQWFLTFVHLFFRMTRQNPKNALVFVMISTFLVNVFFWTNLLIFAHRWYSLRNTSREYNGRRNSDAIHTNLLAHRSGSSTMLSFQRGLRWYPFVSFIDSLVMHCFLIFERST